MEQQLLARIEKLEVANLRLKRAGAVCLLLLTALGVFVAFRKAPNGTVQANEFLLKDSHGETVAKLSTKAFGTCFEIFGREKAAGAELCAGDDYGASLSLTNHHGESKAFISAGSRQFESIGGSFVPTLLISERDGKNLVSATLGRDAKLIVGHGTEENSFVISATQSKSTASLIGPNGKAHWTVP